VIVVASGHGAPGRTTIALSLATALGAVVPTALVDADMAGPSVAAHVDADPTRNLAMLAHAGPATPGEWAQAVDQELQPLGRHSAHCRVLCGIPKVEMRSAISSGFFERLLAELSARHRYVVVDVGAELLGSDAAVHRVAVAVADRVLVVAVADAIGLWHAREAVRVMVTHVTPAAPGPSGHGRTDARVALVLNRYDGRYHHDRREIEWALGVPVAGVIPCDHAAAHRATEVQQPLAADPRSRAGRALLDLAGRVHQNRVAIPLESDERVHEGLRIRANWASLVGASQRLGAQAAPAVRSVLPAAGAWVLRAWSQWVVPLLSLAPKVVRPNVRRGAAGHMEGEPA
jgi:MinD-like ATPase involved in chromosome partitioning or flagellar assembly